MIQSMTHRYPHRVIIFGLLSSYCDESGVNTQEIAFFTQAKDKIIKVKAVVTNLAPGIPIFSEPELAVDSKQTKKRVAEAKRYHEYCKNNVMESITAQEVRFELILGYY
jgi:hypothetical protein